MQLPSADDVLHLIRSRRTIRFFKDDPVSDDALGKILEAGRWASSAGNQQGNEFIVIKDKRTMTRIMAMMRSMHKRLLSDADVYRDWHRTIGVVIRETSPDLYAYWIKWRHLDPDLNKREMFFNPPVMIVPITDQEKYDAGPYIEPPHRFISLCFAIENMMLTAWSLGLGTCTLTIIDPVEIRAMLNVPSNFNVVCILPFGYPAQVQNEVTGVFMGSNLIFPRRPLKDMVHYETFDLGKWMEYRGRDPFAFGVTLAERKRRVEALGGEWPEGWDVAAEKYR